MHKNKGITLIALVVTIVILLILAGVSINLVLGPNGLITKAQEAAQKTNQAMEDEEKLFNSMSYEIDKWLSGIEEVGEGQIASKNSTINGEYPTYNNPVIPQGYKAVNTENAKWDAEGGPQYNNGLVIQDESRNEWVWVPVQDPDRMFTNGQATLAGTSVTTPYYSKVRVREGDALSVITPGNTSGIREPELLSGYDIDSQYYQIIDLSYQSPQDMAKDFVEDYKAMHDSIYTYQGFYIGRYELTGTVEKPTLISGKVLTAYDVTPKHDNDGGWYYLYKACRNLKPSGNKSVLTTMIWGTQWDETMNWLKSTVLSESAVDSDSKSWGNYKDENVYDSNGSKIIKEAGSSATLNTGVTTYTMKNNIYDLAGNYWEWTQEAALSSGRVIRGGNSNNSGSSYPASYRLNYTPDYTVSIFTSRPVLYVALNAEENN